MIVIRIDNEKVNSGVKFTPDPTPSIKRRKVKLNLTYLRAAPRYNKGKIQLSDSQLEVAALTNFQG